MLIDVASFPSIKYLRQEQSATVLPAGEGIQTGEHPISRDFEHRARFIRDVDSEAAGERRAIETAVTALHQPGLGRGAIIHPLMRKNSAKEANENQKSAIQTQSPSGPLWPPWSFSSQPME